MLPVLLGLPPVNNAYKGAESQKEASGVMYGILAWSKRITYYQIQNPVT